MKVLIIPEDQHHDQYILRPIVEALFRDLGRTARVQVLPEPRLRGAGDALDEDLLAQIVRDYPMIDLFLLMVDRDCNRLGHEEKVAARQREHAKSLIACLACQEIEVWLLALHLGKFDAGSISEVRAECDPKEKWAEPLLARLGSGGPGSGRKRAMAALSGNWRSLRDRCSELREFQNAIERWCTERDAE